MSSISIRLCTEIISNGENCETIYDGIHTGQILSKNDDYIVVKLSESVDIYMPSSDSTKRVSTQYVRLNIPSGKMYAYILRDSSKTSLSIFEYLLVEHSDIARTYCPISNHSWQEIPAH